MKKLIVLLLTALMLFSVTACGGKEEGNTGEVPTITLDMSTLFIVPSLEATQKVEDQLNDYLLNTLHEDFKVHLVITAIGDYFQKIPMELAREISMVLPSLERRLLALRARDVRKDILAFFFFSFPLFCFTPAASVSPDAAA